MRRKFRSLLRAILPLVPVLLVIATIPPALAGGRPMRWDLSSLEERPDDPPALVNPRRDPLSRTAAARVSVAGYTSVQVNVDGSDRNIVGDAANEPSIAVNPLDPSSMVIGWRQFDSILSNFRQAGYGFTADGGATWTFPGSLDPGAFHSDPVLDVDADGNFYYASLTGDLRVWLFKSGDGGSAWTTSPTQLGGDKQWIAIDRSEGPGRGLVHMIWQPFAGCCGRDAFTRSVDDGASLQPPVSVPQSPYFGTLAVGPDGEVYAVGHDGDIGSGAFFAIAKSTDAADPKAVPTFTSRSLDMGGRTNGGGPNPGGLTCQTSVAVDTTTGPRRGHVYVAGCSTTNDSSDPLDVVLVRSTDGGATFGPPVQVNDDVLANNWQWFAALAVSPTGRLDVVWFDTRNSDKANISELFYAWSYDGGTTWSGNVQVSPPFDSHVGWPQQSKLGDYITLVSDEKGAHVAYAATFNGEQDVYYVNVFPDCNANGVSDVADLQERTSTDANLDGFPDECVPSGCTGAGSLSDGFDGGPPLTIAKSAGSALRLSWGASSCLEDKDFAVYEGSLGSFASHMPRVCATGGATSVDFAPVDFDSYYLVAPTRDGCQGSLGLDSEGRERPTGHSPCALRRVLSCGDAP